MKTFIKKWGVLLLIVLIGLYVGYSMANSLGNKKFKEAQEKYKAQIAEKTEKIKTSKQKLDDMYKQAELDREKYVLEMKQKEHESNKTLEALKSKTAAELRKKEATLAEVLHEKEKDEASIIVAKARIVDLQKENESILLAWRLSDIKKDEMTQRLLKEMEEKYEACERFNKALEKELKPTFWKKVKRYGGTAAAFSLGYVVGRNR